MFVEETREKSHLRGSRGSMNVQKEINKDFIKIELLENLLLAVRPAFL